ncbi:MAG: hypothetical protein O3C51_17815 [Planctomycetota bacterium]|nr:hypothetical protein [Planctomycetota bacterium]
MSTVADRSLGFFERLSDRVSPILVRELQQAVTARAFAVTLGVASLVVMMMAVAFTWTDSSWRGGELGRDALGWCVICLAPIAVVVVPLQSLTGMRQEVVGGTAEQLLLTKIRPSRVALGKVAAGLAQFTVYLGVFAPLFGLAYLLRGVSFGSILLILYFGVLSNIAATAFAVAMGSLGKRRNQQQAAQALASIVLFSTSTGLMGGGYELIREFDQLLRAPEFWPVVLTVTVTFVLGTWLAVLVATAVLSHPYENRSTPFRVFGVGALAVGALWLLFVMDSGNRPESAGYLSALLALLLFPIWLWAPCEEEALSPRVRSYVPLRAGLLVAPFLPGGGRGLLYAVVLAALGVALATALPFLSTGVVHRSAEYATAAWLYAPFAGGLARAIRGRLPEGKRWSVVTFTTTVILFFVFALGAQVVLIFSRYASASSWNVLHIFNPFWTVFDGGPGWFHIAALVVVAGLLLLAGLPSIFRGMREVARAAADRRALVD